MNIITAGRVRRDVESLLKAQLPSLLPPLAAQEGMELPFPRTWNRLADFTLIAETQSPAVVVTTPGIVGAPDGGGCRIPVAAWGVRVFIVARGRTFEETADRVAAYVAAVRSALLEAGGLPGLSTSVRWTGETYAELATDQTRTVGAGSVSVTYSGVQTATTLS